MKERNRVALKDDLRNAFINDHWKHVYNWTGLNIDALAKMYNCTPDDVRTVMAEVEKSYPKRKPRRSWRQVEFEGSCRTCGKTIGFSRTKKGRLMPVNLLDFTTHWGCEKPGKRKRKG